MSMTNLGSHAFRYCTALTDVTFVYNSSKTLTIEGYAFNCCSSLESITLPNNVASLASYTFTQCSSLTSIQLSQTLTSIKTRAIDRCTALESIVIPQLVSALGSSDSNSAFYGCSKLSQVTLLNANTTIKGGFPTDTPITLIGFAGSTAQEFAKKNADDNVTFSSPYTDDSGSCGSKTTWSFDAETRTLTISGMGATSSYNSWLETPWAMYAGAISRIIVEEGVTALGSRVFMNCRVATSISLPNTLTKIGQYSIKQCHGLTCIKIPESVTTFSFQALNDCDGLISLVIPASVTTIGNQAFSGCDKLATAVVLSQNAECGTTSAIFSNTTTVYCYDDSTMAAHANKYGIPKLPITTEYTGTYGDNITWKINVLTGVMTISGTGAMDNFASTTAAAESGWYTHRALVRSLIVENGVTSLANYGFAGFLAIESVSFPASLTNIGKYAFSTCSSLDNLTIGKDVVLDDSCFQKCTSLKTLVFEEGRTSLTARVFAGCTALEEVVIPTTVTTFGYNKTAPFNGCTGLKTITFLSKDVTIHPKKDIFADNKETALPAGVIIKAPAGGTVEQYASENGYTFEAIVVDTSLGKGEFGEGLSWVVSEDGVLTVSGNGAMPDFTTDTPAPWFTYADKITSIVVSEGITKVGKRAFNEPKTATEVTLPATLTLIDENAFRYCYALIKVNFTKSTTELTIGTNAFNQCKVLPAITIPSNVILLGTSSFTQCYAMTTMVFEEGVTAINQKTFNSCKLINNIIFPASLKTLGSGSASAFTNYCNSLTNLTFLNKDTRDIVINGYHFITINVDENLAAKGDNGANMKRPYGYDFSEETVALATQLIEAAVADTPDKPIFIIQHVATSDTVLGSVENYETEDGKIGKNDTSDSAVPTLFDLQSKYPNLVVFSGHSHAPINDVASIHQEYFTSLNTGVLGGSSGQSRVDGVKLDTLAETNPNVTVSAGNNDDVYLIEVDAHNRVRIRVWDTKTQNFVGETFMVDSFDPFGFKYTEGRYSDSDIFFDGDAVISEGTISTNAITVTFPMVSADSVVARLYKLVATDAEGNETVGYVAPEYYTGQVAPITTTISGLKPNTDYTLEIYAINPMYSYDIMDKGAIYSEPLTATFTTKNDQVVEGGDLITLLLDSKTGTTLNAAGNKVSATVNGTPGVSFDPVIGMDAITFSGDNTQSIAYGFSSVMDKLTDGFSVEAFFKLDEMPTNTAVAFGAMQSCAFGLVLDSTGTFRFDIHNGSTYKKISSQTQYETNTYYHVVCNFDGTTAYLYVNGVLEGSVALDGNLYLRESHCTLQLGADYKNTGTKIDTASKTTFAKFNLYSDPMTAEEVAEAYAKLPRKNAVILEMKQTDANKGGVYGDFSVYVQTSDPSGEYYVRYDFVYKHNTTATGNADSGNDLDMFRVEGAYLVKVAGVSETAVTVENVITKVLQTGEIALAIKENRDDNGDGTNDIPDFVGGFHGDEKILADAVALAADGVTYFPGTEDKVVVCTTLTFNQKTVLDRCNTDVQVMTHDQKYTITSAGLSTLRSVEWLTGDFTLLSTDSKGANSYLQLFTMYRKWEGNAVCDTVSTYDAYGNHLGTTTISGTVEKERIELYNTEARFAKYSSATTGISATVGFKTLNDQVEANGAWIKVRNDEKGDNKWYASFSSTQNGLTPAQGEVWEIEAFYHIDYVNPNK